MQVQAAAGLVVRNGAQVYPVAFFGASAGSLIGGGRDNYVSGNSFKNCRIGATFDNRGMNWENYSAYTAWD